MMPLNGKPTKRGLRRARRGFPSGRRATHAVQTTHGRHRRAVGHNAYWQVLYGQIREQRDAENGEQS